MSASAALRRVEPAIRTPREEMRTSVREDADIVALPKSEPVATWRHPADMHKGVYLTALGCWAAFLSVFWITFSASGNALFMIVISTVYAAVFFSVPVILTRLVPEAMPVKGAFRSFLEGQFSTIDGSIRGIDALVQVIVVPACLAIGGVAIGFAIHAARIAH